MLLARKTAQLVGLAVAGRAWHSAHALSAQNRSVKGIAGAGRQQVRFGTPRMLLALTTAQLMGLPGVGCQQVGHGTPRMLFARKTAQRIPCTAH